MNILLDTNVLIKILRRYSDSLYVYEDIGGNKPNIDNIINNLIGSNNIYISNLIGEEFSRVSFSSFQNGDFSKEARIDMMKFLSSIKNRFDYDSRKEKYVTRTDLEQQNDQRIYISASDNGVTHILTYDNHFKLYPRGFAHICETPAEIIRPNKNFKGFHNFNENFSNSIAGRFLKRIYRLFEKLDYK